MKTSILLTLAGLFFITSASHVQAQVNHVESEGGAIHGGGIGGLGTLVSCGEPAHGFEIRTTAAPGYIQGLYTSGSNNWNFTCKRVNKPVAPGAPSAGKIIWECDELRDVGTTTEGLMQVRVSKGGFTGMKNAEISQKQMFPLQNKSIESFSCKK